MVMVLDDQFAVTPAGRPVAVPIPVAPVVVWVMLVNAVFTQTVGVLEATPAVTDVTVPAPVATFCVTAPVDVTVTLPLAPLEAELVSRTQTFVDSTVPEVGAIDTEEA